MRASRLTTRLLVGCGAFAAVWLTGQGAASADHQASNPPPKRPVITSSPASPGTDSTPTWTWTDPTGLPDTCELRFGGATVIGPAPCSGSITYDLTALPYGTYTFLVENADAWTSDTYLRMPAAPVITSEPTTPDNDATPTWGFTLPPGTAGQCSLLQGATVVDGPVACAGTQTFTLTAGGTYTFRVVAVGNGLTSAADTSTYTFDSTPPPDPVITGSPTDPSADDTPTWTFTTSGDTASTLCSLTGALAPCTSPATFSLAGQPSGTYTFTVVAVDAAGNQSNPVTSSFVRLAPPTITSAPASPGNDATPTWTYTVAGAEGTECTLLLGATVVDGPVACGTSYTPTLVTDGTYTFEVRAVDLGSGTRSAPVTSTYTFDSTPPPAPVITGFPSSPTTDDTPTFVFTTGGDTVGTTCSITGQAAVPCTSPHTFDLTGQPAGFYTVTITAADAAGNTTPTVFVFERWVPPPPPTITDAPVSPANDTTPTWTFDLPPGTSGQCTFLLGATVVSGPVDCAGGHTFTVAGDGTYTFRVVAVDLVTGLVSAPATSTYTFDGTAPALPVITSGPPSPVYEDFPTWSFTVSADTVSTLCSLSGSSGVVYAEAPCTSPATFDLSAQPDGAYTFAVKAIDAVGNVSGAATSTYTLDRTPPTPTITASPTTPGNDTTPTWSFTTPAGTVTECTLLLGSTVVEGPVACTASHTFIVTTDGTYTFQVVAIYTAIGRVGAPASSTYTLDTTGPVAPVFTTQPTSPSNVTNPRWTYTTSADTASRTCTLTRDGVVVSTTTCGNTFQPNLSSQPDGTFVLTVTPRDALGNAGTPVSSSPYVLDRVAPSAPNLTGGPTTLTNTSTPTWTFTTDPVSTTTCSLTSGATTVFAPATCSGSVNYDLSALPDGNYTLNLLSRDPAGNTSSLSIPFTLDRTAPAAPKITDGPTGTSSDDTPSWKFTSTGSGVTTECSVLAGTTVVVGPVLCSSPAAFDLTDQPDATYTFSVVARDAAGNLSAPATSSYSLRTGRVAPAPVPPAPPPPAPTPPPVVPPLPEVPLPDDGAGGPGSRPGRPTPGPVVPPVEPPTPGSTTTTTIDSGPTAPVERIIEQAGRVVTEASRRAAFPLLLLGLVFLFLVIQNRIDSRDPKLANAPVHAGDELEFGPPPSRRGRQ